jgi:hypothetical protein
MIEQRGRLPGAIWPARLRDEVKRPRRQSHRAGKRCSSARVMQLADTAQTMAFLKEPRME